MLSCELQVGAALALVLYELHLVQRRWECVNVHVFSSGTMHITHYLFGSPTNDVTRDGLNPSVCQLHKFPCCAPALVFGRKIASIDPRAAADLSFYIFTPINTRARTRATWAGLLRC